MRARGRQGAWTWEWACKYVALLIQLTTRIRHIATSFTTFIDIISQGTIIGGYGTQNVRFAFLYKFSNTFIILRRTERDITINVKTSSCKLPVILVRL